MSPVPQISKVLPHQPLAKQNQQNDGIVISDANGSISRAETGATTLKSLIVVLMATMQPLRPECKCLW